MQVAGKSEPVHGAPEVKRNDRLGFDKYVWPPSEQWPIGLELHIYDDGRVKIGGWWASVSVEDVSNFGPGKSNASCHVKMRFREYEAPRGT
jgi:hypothetical protein